MNDIKKYSFSSGWRKKNGLFLKFLAGGFALFLFLSVLNLFNSEIKNIFYLVSRPIEKIFWSAGNSLAGFSRFIIEAGSLAKENENLTIENQKLLLQINFLQASKKWSEAQNLSFKTYEGSGFELVAVEAIGLDGEDQISINKGFDNGISEGMPVVNQQNVLFGKVSRVYKNFSKVTLISDKESVVNIKVMHDKESDSEAEIYGIVKGNGGLSAHLDLVLVDSFISQGDVLVTSMLEKVFPKNLLIGKITKVEKNDKHPYQQAKIELFLDIRTDNLFVITNYKQS